MFQIHRLQSGELIRIYSRRQRRIDWKMRRKHVEGKTRQDRTDSWRTSWEPLRGDL